MGTSAPRLVRTGTVDLPVFEASGLALREAAARVRVLVIGDGLAHLGLAAVEPGDRLGSWSTLDFSTLDGSPESSLWFASTTRESRIPVRFLSAVVDGVR